MSSETPSQTPGVEERDAAYAARFWSNQPEGMREAMVTSIDSAASTGELGLFVDPGGITEKDRQRLSAYRALAKELGYDVGQYTFNPNSYAAIAPISRISPDS